jgi:hypothetical protein
MIIVFPLLLRKSTLDLDRQTKGINETMPTFDHSNRKGLNDLTIIEN